MLHNRKIYVLLDAYVLKKQKLKVIDIKFQKKITYPMVTLIETCNILKLNNKNLKF